ncbi:to Chlamydia outer membrane protein, related [Senna tora]|uniref:To Chlamydia outer membrane protein, related n=1 Tax=Senna tora TaxID=362788 RepID=A0A834SMZ2_9FABA|nr:to Chlamydia outer membrane protein, related [Senna tora]
MLNRSILQVALKYVEFDLHSCNLAKILNLGVKANTWCSKHLAMTLLSTQESQEEEHTSEFYQPFLKLYPGGAAVPIIICCLIWVNLSSRCTSVSQSSKSSYCHTEKAFNSRSVPLLDRASAALFSDPGLY